MECTAPTCSTHADVDRIASETSLAKQFTMCTVLVWPADPGARRQEALGAARRGLGAPRPEAEQHHLAAEHQQLGAHRLWLRRAQRRQRAAGVQPLLRATRCANAAALCVRVTAALACCVAMWSGNLQACLAELLFPALSHCLQHECHCVYVLCCSIDPCTCQETLLRVQSWSGRTRRTSTHTRRTPPPTSGPLGYAPPLACLTARLAVTPTLFSINFFLLV